MGQTDTSILNKKLAEWAEFKLIPRFGGTDMTETLWRYPDGDCRKEIPDFPNSLDDCFKHLVPKLESVGLWVTPKGFYRWEATFVDKGNYYNSYYVERKNPALALCRAIEKVIDGNS